VTPEKEDSSFESASLALMAVLSAYQYKGIRLYIIRVELEEYCLFECRVVFLVCYPGYYQRFDLLPAKPRGIVFGFEVCDEARMLMKLYEWVLGRQQGTARFSLELKDAV